MKLIPVALQQLKKGKFVYLPMLKCKTGSKTDFIQLGLRVKKTQEEAIKAAKKKRPLVEALINKK
jgi:hypothetical protein